MIIMLVDRCVIVGFPKIMVENGCRHVLYLLPCVKGYQLVGTDSGGLDVRFAVGGFGQTSLVASKR